jgi:hypothetical protein
MVDAIDLGRQGLGWRGRSLSTEWLRELERMRKLGITVELTEHGYFQTAAEAIEHPDYGALLDRWLARPERQREEFANRYADNARDVVLRYLDTSAASP